MISFGQNSNVKYASLSSDSLTKYQNKVSELAKNGNYTQAIMIERRLAEYYKKYGTCHDYARCLTDLGGYLSDAGEYEKALLVRDELISIIEDCPSIELNNGFDIFYHIAIFSENVGNHEDAQRFGLRALELAEQMPIQSFAYPRILIFLAYSCSELGDYDMAIEYCEKAKSIYDKLSEDSNDEYYHVLNDLGAYYCYKGDTQKAIELGWDCINYLKNHSKTNHSDYVIAINNLARYYAIDGDNATAIDLTNDAMNIIIRLFPDNMYLQGRTYEHLSTFYANNKDFQQAVEYSEKAINCFTAIWSDDRPGIITQYRKHLHLSYLNNSLSELEDEILLVAKNTSEIVLKAFSYLPSSGRSLYWQQWQSWYFEEFPRYINKLQTESLIESGYDAILLSKGILLNSEVELIKLIESSNDSTLIQRFRYLQQQYQSSLVSNNASIQRDSVLKALKEEETQIVSLCKKYGDYTRLLNVCWQDVQKELSEDEIAVEFSRIINDNGQVFYVAYVLKSRGIPTYHWLCEEEQLKEYSDESLYSLIWKPIERELNGIRSIYFSPDGELYSIPIESMWLSNDVRMFEKYNMYRLSSTRELANKRMKSEMKRVVLFGGLNYDTAEVRSESSYVNEIKSYNLIERSIIDENRDHVPFLRGSKEEVITISRLLPDTVEWELYTDINGTEEAFKALPSKEMSILHVSTHGYYWPPHSKSDESIDELEYLFASKDDEALIRSGLYLSGVNTKPSDANFHHEDGVLTAHEISRLDFYNLDLVVLSACETGLGDLKSDGIYGMQRGFKKAGANSILMSLWKVDDYTTKLLMTEFYKNFFSGTNKLESLRNAQKTIQDYTNDSGEHLFEAPYYWAGFVLLDALY